MEIAQAALVIISVLAGENQHELDYITDWERGLKSTGMVHLIPPKDSCLEESKSFSAVWKLVFVCLFCPSGIFPGTSACFHISLFEMKNLEEGLRLCHSFPQRSFITLKGQSHLTPLWVFKHLLVPAN